MRPYRFAALLLTLLCARAQAQAIPTAVTIAGTFQSELGCAEDWSASCPITHLEPNPVDGIWRKLFVVPGGPQEFKAAINDSWDENYGANAQYHGPNIPFSHTEETIAVKFFYDPVTHWVTNSTVTPIAVLAGSFQSEVGCPDDWAPACMLTWLKDIDGDWVQELRIPTLPAGAYEVKVAHHESWEENYGANGERDGADIPFTVPAPGQELRFTYDTPSHRLVIRIAAPTATALTVSPNPARVGETVTLTAAVAVTEGTAVPVGEVMFKVDGVELGAAPLGPDGVATLQTAILTSGTFALTAEYGGSYEPSLSIPVVLQTGVATTTALAAAPSSTVYGQPFTLTATVTAMEGGFGTPTGQVVFRDGDMELARVALDEAGQAVHGPTSAPAAGDHAYSAEYVPSEPYFASRGTVAHTVSRATTEVSLASDETPKPLGLPITFSVQVRAVAPGVGTPTGNVSITAIAGGIPYERWSVTLDANGQASVVATGLPRHRYTVIALYEGDGSFLGGVSPEYFQEVVYPGTRTDVSVSPVVSRYGQPVDIGVQVRPLTSRTEPLTGNVMLQSDNATTPRLNQTLTLDSEARASVRLALPQPGRYNVRATFPEQGQWSGSTSEPFAVEVLRGDATVALGSSRNPSQAGQAVTFLVQVAAASPLVSTPGGTVTFLDGSQALATVPLGGEGLASHTTSALEPGEHAIAVQYSGDTRFEQSASEVLLQVVRAPELPDAGSGGTDAGSPADAGSGDVDAGSGSTDAGSGDTDAGSPTDAGSGDIDAGSGDTDAGSGDTDAGSGDTDAGSGNTDAGSAPTDAGSGDTDAGTGNTDAGSGDTDAGTGGTDGGSTETDAGTTPDSDAGTTTDAGTQGPDAGTGGADAGVTPGNDDTSSGCGCGAGSGGGSPFLMLGMWMALATLQRRRRSSARGA